MYNCQHLINYKLMVKLKIFLIFLIILSINTNVSSKTKENHYIILDTFQNFDKARLNRAKLSTLSSANIIILSPKQIIKTNSSFTPRSVQKAKLREHFYAFKKINKKEPLENKDNYSVLLGPENKKRIDELSKILGNLKYKNFHLVAYKGILENKKKENTNFLTIDPKDFDLPHVDEKEILPPSK